MTEPTDSSRDACIFCRIADGKCDNELKYQDEKFVVFVDKRPAATYHYLIVPRTHYKNIHSITKENSGIISEMVDIGEKILNQYKGDLNGLRMGFHWPPFHTVSHLHLHIIAPEEEMGFIARGIFKTNSFWFVSPQTALERITKTGGS